MKSVLLACCAMLVAGAIGSTVNALVIDGPEMSRPADAFVGRWRAATGVPIGDRYVLTAQHIGGHAGQKFHVRDRAFTVAKIHNNPVADLAILELEESLPQWHSIAQSPLANEVVVVGGQGFRAGMADDRGIAWSSERGETWGQNRLLYALQGLIAMRFDEPENQVPHECSAALYDSGGGVFRKTTSDEYQLLGIIVSTTSQSGYSAYGDLSFGIAVGEHQDWIDAITGAMEMPPCPSDLNGDGVVDFLDLNLLLGVFGTNAPEGDVDGDGDTDYIDLTIVVQHHGMICGT